MALLTIQTPIRHTFSSPLPPRLLQIRLLTDEARSTIDKAVKRTHLSPFSFLTHRILIRVEKPVVLFMKGTPSNPQCGFSRATVQILGLQGVDPQKFTSYNVLEDNELRSGISHPPSPSPSLTPTLSLPNYCLSIASPHPFAPLSPDRIGIKEYSEWPTVPQLYVNGEFIGGCDIVMNMHQSGELEKVLDSAGVLVPFEDVEGGKEPGYTSAKDGGR